MFPNTPQYHHNVTKLLQRSIKFLNEFIPHHNKPQLTLLSSLNFKFPSFYKKNISENDTQYNWMKESLLNTAVANSLINTKPHIKELQASLLCSLLPKPHWNNSIIHTIEEKSLAFIEKNITDTIATLLHLPLRFFWSSNEKEIVSEEVWRKQQDKLTKSLYSQNQSHILVNPNNNNNNYNNNKCNGGGILHETSLESLIIILTTAKAQAQARYLSSQYSSPEEEAQLTQRLVLYCSDQSLPLFKKAARCIGIQHIRIIQTVYSPIIHNYPINLDLLKSSLAEDVTKGLYPLLISGVFGARVSGAVDPLEEIGNLCKKLNVWFHIDAFHSGLALSNINNNNNNFNDNEECSKNLNKAVEEMWNKHILNFQNAALLADSIHFSISNSFLPTISTVSSASLIYVADITKIRVALQRVNNEDEAGGNIWCTPKITDISCLHLEYPEMRSREIIRLAFTIIQLQPKNISYNVQEHQKVLNYLEQKLRADGRFDCSIYSSCFGMVLFRWLTLADEETESLMWHWRSILVNLSNSLDNNNNIEINLLPRISLGLTRIHKRLYICVGLSVSSTNCEYLKLSDVDLLMDSLKEAAIMVCKEGNNLINETSSS